MNNYLYLMEQRLMCCWRHSSRCWFECIYRWGDWGSTLLFVEAALNWMWTRRWRWCRGVHHFQMSLSRTAAAHTSPAAAPYSSAPQNEQPITHVRMTHGCRDTTHVQHHHLAQDVTAIYSEKLCDEWSQTACMHVVMLACLSSHLLAVFLCSSQVGALAS